MKLSITILTLILAISFAKCEEEQTTEDVLAVAKSSVSPKANDDDKSKIDSETKEQLADTTNDDDELKTQTKQKDSKDANEKKDYAKIDENNDEGSGDAADDSEDDGEADNGDESEEDQSTIKRAEEGKDEEVKEGKKGKKGKKYMAYPMFYPGDYFGGGGGYHSGEHGGGPLGFHPGSIWQYPYPYVHPMYPSPFNPCACKCKDDKEKEKSKKEDKKSRRKQLVPSHYYGPPSAGWGAYQPGHTGAGWGAPYWYKSYIPSSQMRTQESQTEEPDTRTTIRDGLDFGITHGASSANINYGHADEAFDEGNQFAAGWHDGYSEHPIYGTYGENEGRTTFVDPGYNEMENTGLNGWEHGVGKPYVLGREVGIGHADIGHGYGGHWFGGHGYGGHGNGGHGYGGHGNSGRGLHIGHPYVPSHAGINHHAVHTDDAFYGPHTATMPTAQGHVQVASAGHAVGLGGHNLGGFADKTHQSQQGDFVGGIHADLGSHEIHGHHHDHAAAGHLNAPLLHSNGAGHDFNFAEGVGDHFGAMESGHHGEHADLGMHDHFGPVFEGHNEGHEYAVHGFNHRLSHDSGAHAGHGGALDGHIGDSVSASRLFGGVHKSGVPLKKKLAKKPNNKAKGKAKTRMLLPNHRHSRKIHDGH